MPFQSFDNIYIGYYPDLSKITKDLIGCDLFGEALKFNRLQQQFYRNKADPRKLASAIT
jgi:hypothetical protein